MFVEEMSQPLRKFVLLCFACVSIALPALATVPSPKALLGVEPGEWHLRHDQIEMYFNALAVAKPNQTKLQVIGDRKSVV